MTTAKSRRPRGTPEQAEADIAAAIDRLTDNPAAGVARTAVNLAREAGMSRKQLYTYFSRRPDLAQRWRQATADTQSRNPPGRAGVDREIALLRRRISELEQALADWRSLAVLARAEADRQSEIVKRLRDESDKLRRHPAAQPRGPFSAPEPTFLS